MKLITLNAWGGKVREELEQFITKEAETTDVFCFQEVFKGGDAHPQENDIRIKGINPSLYEDLTHLLPFHYGFFCPMYKDSYGLAIFVRSTLEVQETGEILLYENNRFPDPENKHADHTRKLQWIRIGPCTVINLHGHWTYIHKNDTPERLVQVEKIISFIRSHPGPFILCGDFNLAPNTASIRALGTVLTDLIAKNNIRSTRTNLYTYVTTDPLADYIFVSPEITVQDFRVLSNIVSDHAPLSLTFNLA